MKQGRGTDSAIQRYGLSDTVGIWTHLLFFHQT
jgi:hypothetical protein